jgi:hypothetical protein
VWLDLVLKSKEQHMQNFDPNMDNPRPNIPPDLENREYEAQQRWTQADKKAAKRAQNAADAATHNTAQNVSDAGRQAAQNVSDTARGAAQNVSDAGRQAAQNVGDTARGTAQNVSDIAGNVAKGLGGSAAASGAGQTAQRTGDTARNVAQSFGGTATPEAGQAVPQQQEGIFSVDEWNILIETPLTVGKDMVMVSPSGPVGIVREAITMAKGIQELLAQGASNPLIKALGQRMQGLMNAARSGQTHPFGNLQQGMKSAPEARNDALSACQQAMAILRKAPPQDALAYKQFVFALAQKVSEAASEEGFLSFGGKKISEAEAAMLRDLAATLELPRA